MSNLDPDSDIYGRHAAGPDRPIGVPARWFGRLLTIPWSAFVYPGAAPVARHAARPDHPAGAYFERAGVVHREPFGYRGGFEMPYRVDALCRHGEKSLKKLTSRD